VEKPGAKMNFVDLRFLSFQIGLADEAAGAALAWIRFGVEPRPIVGDAVMMCPFMIGTRRAGWCPVGVPAGGELGRGISP